MNISIAVGGTRITSLSATFLLVFGATSTHAVSRVVGTGSVFPGKMLVGNSPTQTRLDTPAGVALFPDGRVLIADCMNHRVLEISADGKSIKRLVGTGDAGARLIENDPTQTQLKRPWGVGVFPDGRAVIADAENHRVLVVSADGKSIKRLAGTDSAGARLVEDDPTKTQLHSSSGVGVLPDGRVVIADSRNHRVLVVSSDGKRVKRLAGTDTPGDRLVEDDPTKTQLHSPTNVGVFPDGRVLIADTDNYLVLVVSASGTTIRKFVAGSVNLLRNNITEHDPVKFKFNGARAFAVLPDGDVLISNILSSHVFRVSADGKSMEIFAGTGSLLGSEFTESNPLKTRLNGPSGLAVYPDGRVLIAELRNNRVLLVGDEHFDDKLVSLVATAREAVRRGDDLAAFEIEKALGHDINAWDTAPDDQRENLRISAWGTLTVDQRDNIRALSSNDSSRVWRMRAALNEIRNPMGNCCSCTIF